MMSGDYDGLEGDREVTIGQSGAYKVAVGADVMVGEGRRVTVQVMDQVLDRIG